MYAQILSIRYCHMMLGLILNPYSSQMQDLHLLIPLILVATCPPCILKWLNVKPAAEQLVSSQVNQIKYTLLLPHNYTYSGNITRNWWCLLNHSFLIQSQVRAFSASACCLSNYLSLNMLRNISWAELVGLESLLPVYKELEDPVSNAGRILVKLPL